VQQKDAKTKQSETQIKLLQNQIQDLKINMKRGILDTSVAPRGNMGIDQFNTMSPGIKKLNPRLLED
jgi:hypothetical protein